MGFSDYLSKRISWDPPLRLPRPTIASFLSPQSLNNKVIRSQVADDTSTNITAITYPTSPATSKGAKFRGYIRRTCEPFVRRFRPRGDAFVPASAKLGVNTTDIPVFHSRFQLPPSPPSTISSSTSPTLPALAPTSASQLQAERAIHAEQDAAYERAKKRDLDLCKKLREKRMHEEEQLKRLVEQEEEQRIREREGAVYRRAQNDWRRWARRALVPPPQGGDAIQLAVRLPCGERYIGNLVADASLEVAHIFVETLLIPSTFRPEDDPEDPPEGYDHHWGFRLVMTNPRFVVPNVPNSRLLELESIRGGALLIVEEIVDTRSAELQKAG